MIQIIEKPEWVSWNNIHEVMWKAHKVNREQGIIMRYPSLPGEEIRKRIEGKGKMFIALDGDKVVGTDAIIIKKASLWCGKGDYAYQCFASVLPEYGGQGVYKQLNNCIERECIDRGLSRIMFDTNERNSHIAEINVKHGYKKVSYKLYGDHFSIVFVKWLDGCPYSDARCRFEFFRQKLMVKVKDVIHSLVCKH